MRKLASVTQNSSGLMRSMRAVPTKVHRHELLPVTASRPPKAISPFPLELHCSKRSMAISGDYQKVSVRVRSKQDRNRFNNIQVRPEMESAYYAAPRYRDNIIAERAFVIFELSH